MNVWSNKVLCNYNYLAETFQRNLKCSFSFVLRVMAIAKYSIKRITRKINYFGLQIVGNFNIVNGEQTNRWTDEQVKRCGEGSNLSSHAWSFRSGQQLIRRVQRLPDCPFWQRNTVIDCVWSECTDKRPTSTIMPQCMPIRISDKQLGQSVRNFRKN